MGRRKRVEANFEQECRRIAGDNLGKIERWLDRLGDVDPEAAIKAWVHIAEFAHAKKARDSKPSGRTQINILMQPAERRTIEPKPDDYVDITPKEKGQNE